MSGTSRAPARQPAAGSGVRTLDRVAGPRLKLHLVASFATAKLQAWLAPSDSSPRGRFGRGTLLEACSNRRCSARGARSHRSAPQRTVVNRMRCISRAQTREEAGRAGACEGRMTCMDDVSVIDAVRFGWACYLLVKKARRATTGSQRA